jgi:hypothetical protein
MTTSIRKEVRTNVVALPAVSGCLCCTGSGRVERRPPQLLVSAVAAIAGSQLPMWR